MTHDDHPLVRNAQPTATTKASGEVGLSGSVSPSNTGFSYSGDLHCVLLAFESVSGNLKTLSTVRKMRATVLGTGVSAEICSPVLGAAH